MRQFNLIDEKWIPVRFPDGTRDELGIRETLLRAKEITAIEDASPLVVAALHRFLLAVLYRALEGPTDIGQAKKLFNEGLREEKITAYLEKWRDRFWLFDEKYPFGQIPTFEPNNWRAWSALAVEHNADNAKVLFDHMVIDTAGTISSATAARWLLATQAFAVSSGKSEISHTGTAPSAGSVMVIPVGVNLLDTLIFCLVPQNRIVMQSDVPLWEKVPESIEYLKTKSQLLDKKSGKYKDRAVERGASGIVDLYTWRTRSVLFKESLPGFISRLGFASGVGYKEAIDCDPMLAYTIKEVAEEGTTEKIKKRFSIQFEDRGLWRDFDSLLPDDLHLAPKVIDHAVELTKKDLARFPRGIMTLGQRYFPPRPNIAFWRKEHFALPVALAGDRSVRSEIHQVLVDAENTQKALWSACSTFARNLLSRGERPPDKKDVQQFVDQMTVSPLYWSILEANFHSLLVEFSLEQSSDDIRCQWLKSVRSAVQTAWNQHRVSIATGDAWAIRALVKSEEPVRRKLSELNQEIQKLEPKEETG
jgi:CRISPR system Cascade subunit CasA